MCAKLRVMPSLNTLDARLLLALVEEPRATVLALAERLGVARNTVHARLTKLQERGALASFARCVDPAALGYPLTAHITASVTQQRLAEVATALAEVPEVIEVHGISGNLDLLIRVVARDAEDLYRIAGAILATPGIERTTTALVMRNLVDHRIEPLLRRALHTDDPGRAG